ncbi:hypothetical protein AVDCRST_MAG92-155 [uncultured Coleofasciculus sp.]|uniref:Uncharacterized protein n=1 Tax=uncultured Coleofasciculus sp. TaxID=1267456 RepID=A0A6J4H5W7_9CYAN|nr:hypothetical protein AVDCRST_MAG92-155 [uncultured Coleofasciculus sp.]
MLDARVEQKVEPERAKFRLAGLLGNLTLGSCDYQAHSLA